MKSVRKWMRILFGFSRRETNGFLVIMALLGIVLGSQPVFQLFYDRTPPDYTTESRFLDSVLALSASHANALAPPEREPVAVNLFIFDPNTATKDEWMALGIKPDIAQRILNYRAKGGRFTTKEALLKIYGFETRDFKRLHPWISIPRAEKETSDETEYTATGDAVRRDPPLSLDLNSADTTGLKKVYGIGSVLSSRIVRFREQLGGFVRMEQLYEVYNLDSVAVDRLARAARISPDFKPKQINLNTASETELSAHPYITRPVARVLVAYRFQHGGFDSVAEIRNIQPLTDEIFTKLEPYVSVD